MDKRAFNKFEKFLKEYNYTIIDGKIVDEDGDCVKMKTTALAYGVSENSLSEIVKEYVDMTKPKERNNTFDETFFKDFFVQMMQHKNYNFDVQTLDFQKTIMIGNEKEYVNLDHTELNKNIENMVDLAKLNEGLKLSPRTLLNYKDVFCFDMYNEKMQNLFSDIAYVAGNDSFADNYLTRLHKHMKIKEDVEIFITLMKHFIWQIKRRMLEKTTHNDIMICLYGAQGVGKSFLCNAIFGELFGNFYNASISFDNLLDERWTRSLSNQFVMNIEEMDAGGNKFNDGNLATLKKYLTGKDATYRPMGTNEIKTIPIKSSFISTANYHIYKVISDETGMRRFFEFNMDYNKTDRMDYNETEWFKSNSKQLFNSIDEKIQYGFWNVNSEVGKKISEIQKTYINNSAFKFLSTTYELDKNMKLSDGLKITELYMAYESDCISQGIDKKWIKNKENFKQSILEVFDNNQLIGKAPGGIVIYKLFKKASKDDTKPTLTKSKWEGVE